MRRAALLLVLAGCAASRDPLPPRGGCLTIVGRPWSSPQPVEAASSRLAHCYEANEIEGASASATFSLRIGPDGTVTAVGVASESALGSATLRCLEDVLRSTTFDPPGGGGGTTLGHLLFLGRGADRRPSSPPRPPLDLGDEIALPMPPIVILPSPVPPEMVWMHEAQLAVEACVDPPALAPPRQVIAVAATIQPTGDALDVNADVEGEATGALGPCVNRLLRQGAFRARPGALAERLTATFVVTRGVVRLER